LSINRWTKQEVRRAKLERENAKIKWEKKKQGFELGEVRVDWTRRQKRLWKKKRRKNSKLK
jgi:hypothetical protein